MIQQRKYTEYKQEEWFILLHRDNCTICGRHFIEPEITYFGRGLSGKFEHTCEDCKEKLSSYRLHNNYENYKNIIPSSNVKLWRYIDFTKFMAMLEKNTLHFTRLDNFSDPYECMLGIKNKDICYNNEYNKLLRKNKNSVVPKEILVSEGVRRMQMLKEKVDYNKRHNYANCWHQSEFESEAMWNLYTNSGKQGIAIQTTFERLFFSIESLPNKTMAKYGLINYIDYNEFNKDDNKEKTFLYVDAPWYKRKSFEHEKEFRILIKDISNISSTDYYKEVKVDLRSLIETIYVSPQSEDWFFDLVKTMRRKYNLCCDVKRSELNDSPYV